MSALHAENFAYIIANLFSTSHSTKPGVVLESDWTNESPLLEEFELEVEKDGDPEMEKGKVM